MLPHWVGRNASHHVDLFHKQCRLTIVCETFMQQVITAKLKLHLSQQQKQLLTEVSLSYGDALNYASSVAFDNGKTASGNKLQKLVYRDLRARFELPAQMACNVPRQVANTYKVL